MAEPLCLLTVHAHPDDESSKGAGTVALYGAQGVRTVLVCCTGGEEGDILNPALDNDEVRARLPELRREELERATTIIGYDHVELLGYRDSGMPGTEANARPDAFANADMDEAVARLVALIRQHRAQVVVTYGDDQIGYPHPDHLMVHEASVRAFTRAGSGDWYPDRGEPFSPSKLYYTGFSRRRILAMHDKMVELGIESPFTKEWFDRPSQDHRLTTSIDVTAHGSVRRDALLAHGTQVDPNSPFWFALPEDVAATVYPYDDYVLAASTVGPVPPDPMPEIDLFAGLR
jgi:mycothiol S-conjugate amidase